jgi:hypothetical protein
VRCDARLPSVLSMKMRQGVRSIVISRQALWLFRKIARQVSPGIGLFRLLGNTSEFAFLHS